MISFETQILRSMAAAALFGAVTFAVWSTLADEQGPLRRAYSRYELALERRLKGLFLAHSAARIAGAQLVLLALLGLACALIEVRYWYLALALVLFAPILQLEELRRKRLQQIERQLDPFILSLANALKAIPSVTQAFQSVLETSRSPMREEIELCTREMRVGSTLDEALLHMAARVGSSRLDNALTAIVLGRQIGGNLPRVLESTASSIREMARLEGVLRTKTSEAKMQLFVIGAMPLVLLVALSLLSPGYFEPLQQPGLGAMIGIAAVGCWVLALYLARKVLSVSL